MAFRKALSTLGIVEVLDGERGAIAGYSLSSGVYDYGLSIMTHPGVLRLIEVADEIELELGAVQIRWHLGSGE